MGVVVSWCGPVVLYLGWIKTFIYPDTKVSMMSQPHLVEQLAEAFAKELGSLRFEHTCHRKVGNFAGHNTARSSSYLEEDFKRT